MVHWLIPALVAPFINAIVNFIDKYLVTRRINNPLAMQLYTSIVSFCVGILAWIAFGFPFLGGPNIFLGLGVGLLFSLAGIIYYYVISRKDVSDMTFLFGVTPVFTFFSAFLILGETFSLSQFFGFCLVLSAAIMVSLRKNAGIPLFSSTAALILAVDVLSALAAAATKFSINSNSFVNFIILEGWGLGFGGILIYIFSSRVRDAFWENFKTASKKVFGIIGLNETLTVFEKWVSFFALSIGPVALVSVVGGIRIFSAIAIGYLLTILAPSVIREDISKGLLARKIIAAAILIVGLYFIYI